VIDTLAGLFAKRGVPKPIRSDNGPEFVAHAIQEWLKSMNVATLYIEPGSPWQNGYAESFHSRLRDEFLAIEEFETLGAAKRLTRTWKEDYNSYRPHSSLAYRTPAAFAAACVASAAPTLQHHTRVPPTSPVTQLLPS
jgi:transposase InsO family protein